MAFFAVCAALTLVTAARGTELVPERYLRPRDFNHHPFTDVGDNALTNKPSVGLTDIHPYAILASKRPREGRQFPDQENVLYPNPPAAVLPRKPLHIHVQPSAAYQDDPYNTIPKNYAFSYSVKDKHSGDDFSHSQAHNGKATRGQYRVKLPDGRVQVVSYTADHKGYRADVQYEGVAAPAAGHYPYQQVTPAYEQTTSAPHPYVHHHAPEQYYSPTPTTYYQPQPQQYVQHQPSYTPTPAPYEQSYSPTPAPYQGDYSYSATPAPYQQEHGYSITPIPFQSEHNYSPTPATYRDYDQQSYSNHLAQYNSPSASHGTYASPSPNSIEQAYPSPSSAPEQNYASPSPITFPASPAQQQAHPQSSYDASASPGLGAYASPTSAPHGLSQYASPSTPEYGSYASPTPSPFDVQPHLRSTPSPFAKHQFVTSTEGPYLGHILVTPRTQRNTNQKDGASRRVFGAREHVIYRFKSSS